MYATPLTVPCVCCRTCCWQAVRASSAAPYYLEDFACGEDRFQDGAATANNPSVLALQQARLLWPDKPIDVLVSLGCGLGPQVCQSACVMTDAAMPCSDQKAWHTLHLAAASRSGLYRHVSWGMHADPH